MKIVNICMGAPFTEGDSLYKTILKIIHVDHSARKNMGLKSRKLVEEKFDRQIIVEQYTNTIVNI